MRKQRVAFDHAGVAVGGLLARAAAVDQHHRHAALGQMQGRRGADDAGAQARSHRFAAWMTPLTRPAVVARLGRRWRAGIGLCMRRPRRPPARLLCRRHGDSRSAGRGADLALGRHGTNAVAISIVLGIALPPVGALIRPFFAETVFLLLCLAFLRVEPGCAAHAAQAAAAAARRRGLDHAGGAGAGRLRADGARARRAIARAAARAHAQRGGAADLLLAGAGGADGAQRRDHACPAARLRRA